MRWEYRPAICALLFVCGAAHGLPPDVDLLVRQIEKTVTEIEHTLPRATAAEKDYGTPAGFGELFTFTSDGVVIKMVDTLDSDGLSGVDEYYFERDDLIYRQRRRQMYPLWPEQNLSDMENTLEKLYYDRGRLVRMLLITESEIDPRDGTFSRTEDNAGQAAAELLRFARSEYDDLTVFLNDFPTITDWDELGPTGSVPDLPQWVRQYLGELSRLVERRRWEDIVARALPAHYRSQVTELGMSEDQYIRELLGLFGAHNAVARADRISHLEYNSWNVIGRRLIVEGVATTRDGRKLSTRIELVRRFDGVYLTGAVG